MPETPRTSGGKVKHEVFLFSNLILLVIEMKFAFKNLSDYFAQVLLELDCEILLFFCDIIPHLIILIKLQWRWIVIETLPLNPQFMLCYQICLTSIFWCMMAPSSSVWPEFQFRRALAQSIWEGWHKACTDVVLGHSHHSDSQFKCQTYYSLSFLMDTLRFWWRWRSGPSRMEMKAM